MRQRATLVCLSLLRRYWRLIRPALICRDALIGLVLISVFSSCQRTSNAAPVYADTLFNSGMESLAAAHSIRLIETQTRGSDVVSIDITSTPTSSHSVTSYQDLRDEMVLGNGKYYERKPHTDYWVEVDQESGASRAPTLPGIVDCFRSAHGHLVLGKTGVVNGVGVINVNDDGQAPGAGPGTWSFERVGATTRLVQVVHSGPDLPGGPGGCGRAAAGVTIRQTFVDFDKKVTITVPPSVERPGSSG